MPDKLFIIFIVVIVQFPFGSDKILVFSTISQAPESFPRNLCTSLQNTWKKTLLKQYSKSLSFSMSDNHQYPTRFLVLHHPPGESD